MDGPIFTAGVSDLTNSYLAAGYTQGQQPDESFPYILADQLTYKWGFANGVVPGQLEPATAEYGLYCQSAADIPPIQLGDLHKVFVQVGHPDGTGPVVLYQVMKVVEVEVTLEPDENETHPVYVAVKLVDPIVDAIAWSVQQPLGAPAGTWDGITSGARTEARPYWRSRLAEVGKLLGRSIGNPDWWAGGYGGEQPDPGLSGGSPFPVAYRGLSVITPDMNLWNGKSAHELLIQLLNSHQPSGVTHAMVSFYDDPTEVGAYPAGYEYVEETRSQYWPAVTDPATPIKTLLVPASRLDGYHGVVELDADWCEIPAKARRGREHVVNVVNVAGIAAITQEDDALLAYKPTPSTLSYGDVVDAAAYGIQARDLPTQLTLFRFPNETPAYTPLAPEDVAWRFITDSSARDDPWTYDTFQLLASYMDQADAEAILPAICPRYPGELDGDGHVLRHVTLSNLDPSIDFGVDGQVKGFLSSGQLSVVDGDLVFNLTLTPGDPV